MYNFTLLARTNISIKNILKCEDAMKFLERIKINFYRVVHTVEHFLTVVYLTFYSFRKASSLIGRYSSSPVLTHM